MNQQNLDSWQTKIKNLIKENNNQKLSAAYNDFLTEFPLLFAYWKNYALLEFDMEGFEKATQIYEKAVKVLGYSLNLWEYYLDFMVQKSTDLNETRKVFERSIQKLGESPNGGSIWKKYIQFETKNQDPSLLFNIYQRCIRSPLLNLEELFGMFKDFFSNMSGRQFSEYLTPDQSNYLDSELQKEKEDNEAISIEKKKEFFFQNMESVFLHSKIEMEKRESFESQIKRDYFHVVAQQESELDVWRQYLAFEIEEHEKNGQNIGRVCILFERCLIPCACYLEFWRNYWEFSGKIDQDAERTVLEHACFCLRDRPQAFVLLAQFEEILGNSEAAQEIFKNLFEKQEGKGQGIGHIETILAYVAFLKRAERISEADQFFESAAEQLKEKNVEESMLVYLEIQHALFLRELLNEKRSSEDDSADNASADGKLTRASINVEKVRDAFENVTKKFPKERMAWQAQIENEMILNPHNVSQIFEAATSMKFTDPTENLVLLEKYKSHSLFSGDVKTLMSIECKIEQIKREVGKALAKGGAPLSRKRKATSELVNPKDAKIPKLATAPVVAAVAPVLAGGVPPIAMVGAIPAQTAWGTAAAYGQYYQPQ